MHTMFKISHLVSAVIFLALHSNALSHHVGWLVCKIGLICTIMLTHLVHFRNGRLLVHRRSRKKIFSYFFPCILMHRNLLGNLLIIPRCPLPQK